MNFLKSRSYLVILRIWNIPFILYKLGNYYEAYHAYNKILPIAWKRGKYILYFICLYNLWSIRNGVYATLLLEDEKLAHTIYDKLSAIELEDVLGRLPISDDINSNIVSLLSKFERNFQFCNNNYIICDNNGFFKSIGYNTVCGILNSNATPDTRFEGLGIRNN